MDAEKNKMKKENEEKDRNEDIDELDNDETSAAMKLPNSTTNSSAANNKIRKNEVTPSRNGQKSENLLTKIMNYFAGNKDNPNNGGKSSGTSDQPVNGTPQNETDTENRGQSSGSSFQSSNN